MHSPQFVMDLAKDLVRDYLRPYVAIWVSGVMGVLMTWARSVGWRWVAPIFYGLGTAAFVYILFDGIVSPEQQQVRPLRPGFTGDQLFGLRQDFLRLPRPCAFKVTAPLEHIAYRDDLVRLASESSVRKLNRETEWIIPPCRVVEDEMDKRPDLYPDKITYAPPGIVIVSGAPSNAEAVAFFVSVLRSLTGFGIRTETELPPNSPEDLIYIQIGTGTLHG